MKKPIPFGKYYLLERINVGGMAEVFMAKAFGVEGFERLIAVKRILPNIAEDEEFITMFIDEAKIAGQLQHANVAQIFDLGKVDDSYFIAMEYVHGKDLRAIFDHLRKLDIIMPISQLCYTLMQVCEGLDFAHNKKDVSGRALNLVHRDVSPQNILIGYEGEVKLVDFGIAKAAGKASKTQAGILKGKFGYMSPEQVRGLPVDRRSDIFSVGICLYEMLTGERLFVGESDFSTLEKVRNVEILPPTRFNKKVPLELERIVLKALAKEPEDRYQNAIDLHDDLQAFLYSLGELCSRKDLAGWMKRSFASEIEEDNANLEQYRQLSQPMTNDQYPSGGGEGRGVKGKSEGLEWDDEELETQIFDKPPTSDVADFFASPSRSNSDADEELDSSDILVSDVARSEGPTAQSYRAGRAHQQVAPASDWDDQTVAQSAAELLAEMEKVEDHATDVQPGYQQAAMVNPFARRTPSRLPPPGGTFPGVGGAGDEGRGGPRPSGTLGSDLFSSVAPLPRSHQPPSPAAWGQSQTGMPHAPPLSGMAAYAQRQGGKSKLPLGWIAAGVVLVAGGALALTQFNKAGHLQLQVVPEDAEVVIDDQPVKGPFPSSVERNPGDYIVSASAPGYDKLVKNVEVKAGAKDVVEMKLRPSADTGFELVSEPPDRPVWLDGRPLTAGEDNVGPQIRTNFKADRVAPGRHVLEIKDDPQYQPWRYEFMQEPGRILKIQARLEPAAGAKPEAAKPEAAKPARAEPPAAPPVAAAPTPAPEPEPAATPAPVAEAPEPAGAAAPRAQRPARAAAAPRPAAAPAPRPAVAAAPAAAAEPAASGGTCTITLGAKPWARVFIDGEDTGKITPLAGFELPCGKHKVKFVNPELQIEKTENITVRAGEPFKKVFTLAASDE